MPGVESSGSSDNNMLVSLLITTSFAVCAYGAETCCGGLGCFPDAPPFDHLPVPQCPDDFYLKFTLFTKFNQNSGSTISRDVVPPFYDPDHRTIFLIHGWFGGEFTSWLYRMKDALLGKSDVNIVVVSWDSINLWYPTSASNTRVIGREVGLVIQRMRQFGGDPNNMWCIGHSLGAQTCGFVGKDTKIGRITGMDPAGPWFEGYSTEAHLHHTDANFVDVIHTHINPGLVLPLGYGPPMGHVDFYPNQGGPQPGCILDPFEEEELSIIDLTPACSHMRVLDLMEESVTSQCKFNSFQKCTDHSNLPGSCSPCPDIICQVMGYDAENYPGRGMFHLSTNREYPFC